MKPTCIKYTNTYEFKHKHIMNMIFNHVRFLRLSGAGYHTIKIKIIL